MVTSPEPDPPLFPDELVASASERAVLETFLDLYRDAIVGKVGGVSEEDARRRLVGSATTLGGIVKHLRWVELEWFQRVLAGRSAEDLPPVPGAGTDPDAEFHLEPGDTVERLLADYQEACAWSRTTAAGHALDDVAPHFRMGEVSLRWIYVHMIEETARHAGHADILREQLDGTTGT
ncbi:MAG TPA: DinB family protein [Actinomycetota bacterium]